MEDFEALEIAYSLLTEDEEEDEELLQERIRQVKEIAEGFDL